MNEKQRRLLILRIIGLSKFGSGLLLLCAGIGIFKLIGDDLGVNLEHYATKLHLDPDNEAIHGFIAKVSGLSRRQIRFVQVGTFIYAAIHLIEGTGLLLAKRWAEYFTVLATGLLLPVELYEIFEKTTVLRLTIFALNLAVVLYLIFRLITANREGSKQRNADLPGEP